MKKDFLQLVSKKPSTFLKKLEWQKKNSYWLYQSSMIALEILTALEELKMTKADLIKKTCISKIKVNKMVKGRYNFSLKEIRKLEEAFLTKFTRKEKSL